MHKSWSLLLLLLLCTCSSHNYLREQLAQLGWPEGLYDARLQLETLELKGDLDQLGWLSDSPLTQLDLDSRILARLGPLPESLVSLSLRNTRLADLSGIDRLKNLKTLSIKDNTKRLDLAALNKHPSLEKLVLEGSFSLVSWPELPSLTHLEIRGNLEGKKDIDWAGIPRLTTLYFDGVRMGRGLDPLFQAQKKQPSLRKLTLDHVSSLGVGLPDSLVELAIIGGLRTAKPGSTYSDLPDGLTRLSVTSDPAFSFEALDDLPKLVRLDLEGHVLPGDFGLLKTRTPALTTLNLTGLSLDTLSGLASVPISSLALTRMHGLHEDKGNGLALLGTMPQLESLTIDECYLTPAQFQVLENLGNLSTLAIHASPLTHLDVSVFPKLSTLVLSKNYELQKLEGFNACEHILDVTLVENDALESFPTLAGFPALQKLTWEGPGDLGLDLGGGRCELTLAASLCQKLSAEHLKALTVWPMPGFNPQDIPSYRGGEGLNKLSGLQELTITQAEVDAPPQVAGLTYLNFDGKCPKSLADLNPSLRHLVISVD